MAQRFFILVFMVFHLQVVCRAQVLPIQNIVIQDITYLNGGVQTKKGPQFKAFFNDVQNRQQMLTSLYHYVGKRWNTFIDSTSFPEFTTKFGLFSDPNATIKTRLPANASNQTGYLYLLIQGSSGTTYPPRIDQFIFHYQLKKGDRILSEDKQLVSLRDLNDIDNCQEIINKGLSYLFDYEVNLRRKYPKILNVSQEESLRNHFPNFIRSLMLVESYGLAIDKTTLAPWRTEAGKAKTIYTDRKVGNEIATGLTTTLFGIGSSVEKDILLEQTVNIYSVATDPLTCTFRIAGKEVKEKERVKENNMKRVESTVTRTFHIDNQTKGDWANDSIMIATFEYIEDTMLIPALKQVSLLDSALGLEPIDNVSLYFEQKLNRRNTFGIKGEWKGSPFLILYRNSHEVIYFFWNKQLVAFSLQGEYEPSLYCMKNSEAPIQGLCLLQMVLSQHLFKHYSFY